MNEQEIPKKIISIVIAVVLLFSSVIILYNSFENVDNKEIMVVQAPFSGKLSIYTSGGMKPQMFGTVTKYKKSFQYWFDGGEDHNGPIPIKFYDGGHASIPGSIRVDLPLDQSSIIKLHTKYGSQEAIENALIEQVLIKSVSMSGPTMTSKESYAEKKNDLLYFVEDQASLGIYKTRPKDIKVIDALTGQERLATVVEIVLDTAGKPVRQEQSLVSEMNIKLFNLSFGDFKYDDIVKKQIAAQQEQSMRVQTGIANAKRAEQDAITVEQQGKADAAKAKWEQETIKAQAVTEAEQQFEVAQLNAKTEGQNKLALTLKGEGEAAYKRAVTQANNNLELRLEAAVKINEAYAKAMASSNWVPTYVSGATGTSGSNALDLIHLMTANAAKQAGLVPDDKGK